MKTLKFLLWVLVLNSTNTELRAQLSAADSTFLLPLFDEQIYSDDSVYPGNWYTNPVFNTLQGFYDLIDSNFKFQNSQYPNAYSNMTVQAMEYDTNLNQTFNYYWQNFAIGYPQNDPWVKVNFVLNGIQSTSFATFTDGNFDTTCNIAYLIVPGTGFNQTTDVMKGFGYFNIHCFIKEHLSQTGDVFIHTKPLEDCRALRWNGNKLNSSDYLTPGPPSWVYNHLLSNNKAFGLNYIIECLALIKELKTKYKKVVLVGCSLGGFSTLLLSTLCKVDGCILSSGWSVLFDTNPAIQYELTKNFDSVAFNLNKNVVKAKIDSNKTTKYLFTYPNQDEPWYQAEHDSALTQIFLTGSNNVYFDTAYNFHSIPPCPIIDSFIVKVMHFPKARFDTISSSDTQCVAKLRFCGTPPYSFDLFRDSIYLNHYTISNDTMLFQIDTTGKYTIQNITNTFGDTTTCSDTVQFKYKFPAIANEQFESNKFQVNNPFHNELHISFNTKQQNTRIAIYSLQGNILYQKYFSQLSDLKINTTAFSKGIYLLSISSDQNYYRIKICNVE